MMKNKIHGEEVLGTPSSSVLKSIKRSLKQLQSKIKKMESRLFLFVKKEHQVLLTRLETIPGIGKKT